MLVQVLKEILREIDSTLTEDDLLNIIEEVDEDGSGTLDFDEFQVNIQRPQQAGADIAFSMGGGPWCPKAWINKYIKV